MGYGRGLAELIEGKQQRWPTPRANDAEKRGQIANDPRNGLPAAVMYWPTPTCQEVDSMDFEITETGRRKVKDGEGSRSLNLARKVQLWPTPSSNNGTGGATGLAGGSGNRKKLYTLLGKEEGKKMGCQSLNPYWVEWLMGYPIGFTDLKG